MKVDLKTLFPSPIPEQSNYTNDLEYAHDLRCWIDLTIERKEAFEKELRELALDEEPYKGQYSGREMLAIHCFIEKEILGGTPK